MALTRSTPTVTSVMSRRRRTWSRSPRHAGSAARKVPGARSSASSTSRQPNLCADIARQRGQQRPQVRLSVRRRVGDESIRVRLRMALEVSPRALEHILFVLTTRGTQLSPGTRQGASARDARAARSSSVARSTRGTPPWRGFRRAGRWLAAVSAAWTGVEPTEVSAWRYSTRWIPPRSSVHASTPARLEIRGTRRSCTWGGGLLARVAPVVTHSAKSTSLGIWMFSHRALAQRSQTRVSWCG